MSRYSYTIGEAVDHVPDCTIPKPRDQWDLAYRAAYRSVGKWVPVNLSERADARRLAESAKKLKAPMEAVVRGRICFLRMVPR